MDDASAISQTVHSLSIRQIVHDASAHRSDDLNERVLHMFRLPDLVIGPLPMKPEHRDSVFVNGVWIDLAITVVVRDHFAAARKVDRRAPISPIVSLEGLTVTAGLVESLDAAHESRGRRATTSAADLDVIAAGEIELLVVEPPRHVQVGTTDTVFV